MSEDVRAGEKPGSGKWSARKRRGGMLVGVLDFVTENGGESESARMQAGNSK